MNLDRNGDHEEKAEGSTDSFNDRFDKAIKPIKVEEVGDVSYIDIGPRDVPPSRTIFYVPGWLETLDSAKELFRNWVETYGYRVISLQHPRETNLFQKIEVADETIGRNKLSRKGKAIDAVARKVMGSNKQKMDIIAFSSGAIDFANSSVFRTYPNQFGNLLLYNPAGLDKKEETGIGNLKKSLRRYGEHTSQRNNMTDGVSTTKVSQQIREAILKSGTADFKANKFLAKMEFYYGANARIQDQLEDYKKDGHKIAMIKTSEDKIAPAEDDDIPDGLFDDVIPLYGYHNSLRDIGRWDLDNDQHITLEWINEWFKKNDHI